MKRDDEMAMRRGIVDTFDHDDTYLLLRAAETYAAVLNVTDIAFPSPEMRNHAARARNLAVMFRQANMGRDYINKREE